MKRATLVLLITLATLLACSCGMKSNNSTTTPSNMAGQWEIIAQSTQNPGTTVYIEANLQENDLPNDTRLTATGPTQTAMYAVEAGANHVFPNGLCPTLPNSNVAGASDNLIIWPFLAMENNPTDSPLVLEQSVGNLLDVPNAAAATFTPTSMSGSYNSSASTVQQFCSDAGTFTGARAPSFDGQTYSVSAGTQCEACLLTAKFSEQPDGSIVMTGTLMWQGYEIPPGTVLPYTLSGNRMGNLASVTGTNPDGNPFAIYAHRVGSTLTIYDSRNGYPMLGPPLQLN